ncbi:POT family MFS transporter [Alienimonas chondri]|uniref:Dipeptide and tripeptide permease A n=1 Tax=Alienimonas chondri TaxID=2681879 RepID=A0ABX1VI72_9PLAN|nr:POT family MFS transporter [Alienimonas chondri]NNJ26978.1 Dipeptide and tripeptide permease A [Alienimonas chondri]
MATQYRETPVDTDKMPPGIGFIVGNEVAERFSYYGMRAILYTFMTKWLTDAAGADAHMTDAQATEAVGYFSSLLYFLPLVGGLVADALLGKYLTIMLLSVIYCLGHFVLALTLNPEFTGGLIEPKYGLFVGLGLIAVGGGFIKSCVSAHVGDQFGARNSGLLGRVYGWFYFSINLGSTVSTLLTPKLLDWYGPDVAFGVPGVLMLIATIAFWLGRYRYAHVPPKGTETFREAFSPEGRKALANLALVYVFIGMFWALFDQTASRWVGQAEQMDRYYVVEWMPDWATDSAADLIADEKAVGAAEILANVDPDARVFAVLESQMQAVNPALVMLYIPLFGFTVYPLLNSLFKLTYLRKMGIGMFLAAGGWAVSLYIQTRIDAGERPDIMWQVLAYAILTAGEIMVSITGLEFSYAHAPKAMKSIILACWLLTVSIGNLYIAGVNRLISMEVLELRGADYYWFWLWAMLGTAAMFVPAAMLFRGKVYIGEDGGEEPVGFDRATAGRATAEPEPMSEGAARDRDVVSDADAAAPHRPRRDASDDPDGPASNG